MLLLKCCLNPVTKSVRNLSFHNCRKNLSNEAGEQTSLNLSPSDKKKKKIIELEMAIERDKGNIYVPDSVPDMYWVELLKLKSLYERLGFYKYLKKNEDYEKSDNERYETRVAERNSVLEDKIKQNPKHIQYGLGHNSLFGRLSKTAYYNNLRDAVMFGQKLVIDLGYEQKMNFLELNQCYSEIVRSYTANETNREPYYLHLCNANMDGQLVKQLKAWLEILQKPHPLVPLTEKSYLDLFPKDKLVYLSPECDETLKEYDHDDVYIIGGFVDKRRQGTAVSLAKAKQENIRTAWFPLEKHLNWGYTEIKLTIDETTRILLSMKKTMDWTKAFKVIVGEKANRRITWPTNGFSRTI